MAAGCNYLSKDHLRGFSTYKYSSVETSPFTRYVLIPWWNAVVKLCPLWLAPNLITFVGFLMLLSIFFLVWYFDPDYLTTSNDIGVVRPPIPTWVWLYAGVTQFTAHTLDGIDGKQARRTGTSSPLGEMFDHGLDSFGCILLPLSMYSAVGCGSQWSGPPLDCYWVAAVLMIGFYIAHWEKYITGTLYMPWAYDLGEVGGALFYLITGLFGVEVWHVHLIPGWSCAYTFRNTIFAGFALTAAVSLYNVIVYFRNSPENEEVSANGSPGPSRVPRSNISPGVSICALFGLTTAWALYSPNDVLAKEPRLFMVAVGIIFSNITCKLIIAQMSSQPVEAFNNLLLPLFGAVGLAFVLPHYEILGLYGLFVISLVTHLHFGFSVVFELASFFNIRVFLISKPNPSGSPRK